MISSARKVARTGKSLRLYTQWKLVLEGAATALLRIGLPQSKLSATAYLSERFPAAAAGRHWDPSSLAPAQRVGR